MNKFYFVIYPLIWIFMRIFHPWRVQGRENLPEGGVLLCGNHTTLGDPLYVLCAVGHRPQLRVLAKIEIRRVPLLGALLEKCGIIFVDRGKADVGAVKTGLRALKNGEKLLLFPEGTRVREGETSEIHTGAAMFATRTGVPILPVYIAPKKRLFRKTDIIFGEPYHPAFEGRKPTPEDYEQISEDLMDRIRQLNPAGNTSE